MKRLYLILTLLLIILLVAGCNTPPSENVDENDTNVETIDLNDENSTRDETNNLNNDKDTIKLANELLQGRWIGYMKADITAGGPDIYKTVGGYEMDLHLVFTEHPDYPGEPQYRAFSGMANIRYQEPRWTSLGMEGIISVDHDLLTPSITTPVSGKIAHVGSPEKWGEPAQMLFDNREMIYATLTTAVVYDVNPPHTEVSTDKGSNVPFAGELFSLPHLRKTGFMRIEEGYIEFSPLDIQHPLKEPVIEGYLFRVHERTLSSPPQTGEILETEKDEALKFQLSDANSNQEIEIILEPNSTSEVMESTEYDALLNLMSGELLSRVRASGDPLSFEVRTPIAIAGVRGTDFSVRVLENGTTTVTVFEGVVEVTCRKTGETVTLTDKEYVTVFAEKGLSEIEKAKEPFSLTWW